MEEKPKTKQNISKIKKERDEYLEGWKRAKAELINYKDQEIGRLSRIQFNAKKEILIELIKVLDNFERSEQFIDDSIKEHDWTKGIVSTVDQIKELLNKEEVTEIEGGEFDPYMHEAVMMEDGEESGIVLQILEKGYKLNDEVIRPAKVKVSK